jgi:hypothetical protein
MKQEFDFYIDERVMIWNRLKFSVEAETLEEAKDMAIFMVTKDREEIGSCFRFKRAPIFWTSMK